MVLVRFICRNEQLSYEVVPMLFVRVDAMAIINITYSKCISIHSICLHYVFKSHKLIGRHTTMRKMEIHLVRGSENRSQSVTHFREIANIFFAYISMHKPHNGKWKHPQSAQKKIIARTCLAKAVN